MGSTTQAVRDLTQQNHQNSESTGAQNQAVVQNIAAAQAPQPAPELQQLIQTLHQLPLPFSKPSSLRAQL